MPEDIKMILWVAQTVAGDDGEVDQSWIFAQPGDVVDDETFATTFTELHTSADQNLKTVADGRCQNSTIEQSNRKPRNMYIHNVA